MDRLLKRPAPGSTVSPSNATKSRNHLISRVVNLFRFVPNFCESGGKLFCDHVTQLLTITEIFSSDICNSIPLKQGLNYKTLHAIATAKFSCNFIQIWPQLTATFAKIGHNFWLIEKLQYRNFFKKIPQLYCALGDQC